MKELPAVWPSYPSREIFESDQSSQVEYNKEVHGQLVSFIKDSWDEKEDITIEAASSILAETAEKFGYAREESMISPPDINNDPFHPLLKTYKNPEETWDMVEGLDFPPSLADSLRKVHLLDVNTSYLWIHEYRKFLVLNTLFSFKMIPSEKIEHVQRQHMTNSEHYRQTMKLIGALEEPTMWKVRILKTEDYEDYVTTISCYKNLFQDDPPVNVWEHSSSRFDKGNWKSVNLLRIILLRGMINEDEELLQGKEKNE